MADRSSTRTWQKGVSVVGAGLLILGLASLPSSSAGAPAPGSTGHVSGWGDTPPGLTNLDARGRALPTATQRQAADALGAVGAQVRWNDFGTPASILSPSGSLGTAVGSDPVVAARTWLRTHSALLGLTNAQVDDLELVNNQKLADSDARAVLFRQRFGSLTPALGSMVTVGVATGKIVYVSSSLTRTTAVPADAALTPAKAYAGELDNDPLNDTDCAAASDRDLSVRAAELQLFE